MGPKGAVAIIYRNDPNLAQRENEYIQTFANPKPASARGFVDGIIYPNSTRQIICEDLELLENKHLENPKKKHGNIPL